MGINSRKRSIESNHRRPVIDARKHNLIIGPVNSAGQGYAWAKAVRDNANDFEAINYTVVTPETYAFRSDYSVNAESYVSSRAWLAEQRRYILRGFTHALWESGRPPLGSADGSTAWQQIEALRHEGVVPAFVAHGSDVRIPSRHAEQFAWSPFRNRHHELTKALEARTQKLHRHLEKFDGVRFVSTPDLMIDVPNATWLPVVIDSDWLIPRRRVPESPIKIAHVTSNSMIKRSDDIELLIEPLVREGLVEYMRISGHAPSAMRDILLDTDILLDQFGIGSYGVAACEAMALGCAVVGNVTSHVRTAVTSATGMELPIIQAELGTIPHVVRRLLRDPLEVEVAQTAGPEFVRQVHDGRRSASVLSSWLHGTTAN